MDIKLKNCKGKIIKNKSLVFNLILILTIFMVTQIIGIITCFKFFSQNLFMILANLSLINFVIYKIMRKLSIL